MTLKLIQETENVYKITNPKEYPIPKTLFSQLRSQNLLMFWDEEYLEENGMWWAEPGWRIREGAFEAIKKAGIEIVLQKQKTKEPGDPELISKFSSPSQGEIIESEEEKKKELEDFLRDYQEINPGEELPSPKLLRKIGEQYPRYTIYTRGDVVEIFTEVNSDFWGSRFYKKKKE